MTPTISLKNSTIKILKFYNLLKFNNLTFPSYTLNLYFSGNSIGKLALLYSKIKKLKTKILKTTMVEQIVTVNVNIPLTDYSVENSVFFFVNGFLGFCHTYGPRYDGVNGYFFRRLLDVEKKIGTKNSELMDIIVKWINTGTNKQLLDRFTINSKQATGCYELAKSVHEVDKMFI